MKNEDVELIQRVLEGDDNAFSVLVRKYQKQVHALAWRKIGDFHIAEEITQDTFLKAYKRLATLKKPQRFASWLYVIAANRCSSWLRKKRLWTQPLEELEETDNEHVQNVTYSGYVVWKTSAQPQKHNAMSSKSCSQNYRKVNALSSHSTTSARCRAQRLARF